jgi:hypothetical protein
MQDDVLSLLYAGPSVMNEKTVHSYNLKRVLNILGAKPLISAIQA